MKTDTMMAKEDQRRTHVRTDRKEIAERAYKLWCAADRPAGRDLEFWFKAESELLAARHAHLTTASSAPNEGPRIPDGLARLKQESQVAKPKSGEAR
jgi:hypothetical protein